MALREKYMKTDDAVKLLEMLKIATKNGTVDKEMIHHFNKMYSQSIKGQTPENHYNPISVSRMIKKEKSQKR
ncbi:hypothetical protein M3N64_10930 [Sporolactobacillus sp. CPB3-1]|uniref:Uncharacterized protein n=1 Tax=Sporolactobacillus mangiferae TaxID=2940498 RepID=A0ABT0MC29_9BACL|nr:hypothetical protein [Sporolactobacillus mangiferae]MCL1632432.1 hypothetical protein [Sporolactobacillus mangiferae]